MKIRLILPAIIIISVGFIPPAKAQDQPSATNTALAEQLVDLMHLDQAMGVGLNGMKQMQSSMAASMGANTSPEAKATLQKSMDSSMKAAASMMNGQNIKEMYVSVYASVFTAEELQGAIDFYKSPVGQKWVEKQPQVAMAVMAKSMAMMPQMMDSMRKSMATLDALHKLTNAPGMPVPTAPVPFPSPVPTN